MKMQRLIVATILLSLILWGGCSVKQDDCTPVKAREIITLNNLDEYIAVDIMPEMIYREIPKYPEIARINGIGTTVFIKSLVDNDGLVKTAHMVKCDKKGYGFEHAAIDAACKCRFKPALLDDKPVAIWITYGVEFIITQK